MARASASKKGSTNCTGLYPIIGPELATDSVVQPIARQLGLTMLGTLHERLGDSPDLCSTATPGVIVPKAPIAPDCGSGVWGRVFGQQITAMRHAAWLSLRMIGSGAPRGKKTAAQVGASKSASPCSALARFGKAAYTLVRGDVISSSCHFSKERLDGSETN
jgi:hypothetical protein